MADAPKPDEVASSEPKLAATETELATNPAHGDAAKEEAAPVTVCSLFHLRFLVSISVLMVSSSSPSKADNNRL
jgi:hypothetical protein